MSTFHYKSDYGEWLNGVKCDVCGYKLYTDTEDQCFGEHMMIAKQSEWLITKDNGKWLNLCPKCKQALEEKERAERLETVLVHRQLEVGQGLTNKPKAIQTEYNGRKFRSRLEARWAVLFDDLGIDYVYEPEGFEFEDGTKYLPDFYLPELEAWFEVKGVMSEKDEHKIRLLVENSGNKEVFVGLENMICERWICADIIDRDPVPWLFEHAAADRCPVCGKKGTRVLYDPEGEDPEGEDPEDEDPEDEDPKIVLFYTCCGVLETDEEYYERGRWDFEQAKEKAMNARFEWGETPQQHTRKEQTDD